MGISNLSFPQDHPLGRVPQYCSDDGRRGPDPLALAGDSPRFSLTKLAYYLAPPVLMGEFLPDCPWVGVSRLRPPFLWQENQYHQTSAYELEKAFHQSLEICMGDASTVAIALSGGLDSLAVLWHANKLCQRDGRHLFAVSVDLQDDTGQSSREIIESLLNTLQLDCKCLYVEQQDNMFTAYEPMWHPAGPRNDAMPRLNRAMADLASLHGAEVLLSGSGADELLGSVRYLLGSLLRMGKWSSTISYLKDLRAGGSSRFVTEGISLLSTLLPVRLSLPWYWATNWPELCTSKAPVILTKRFRYPVEVWTQQWIQAHLELHCQQSHSWAAADAWDTLFPSDPAPPASDLPEQEPFLTPPFLQVALATRLIDRYAAHLLTPYHRSKALVVQLYPPSLHTALPRTKQIFSQAFTTYHQEQIPLIRCLTTGLINHEQLAICQDHSVLRSLQAIERWIRGAEAHGASAIEE